MGLFDWLRGRRDDDEFDDLSPFAGMRLEVSDENDNLLFSARADIIDDDEMELRPITTPRLRPGATDVPVQMRGYLTEEKKAVHMDCYISPNRDGTWSVDDLEITATENDRGSYRQPTLIGGTVMPLRQRGLYEIPCRLVNISTGGVCLQLATECKIGDRLLLKSSLLEGWQIKPLMCLVRRVTRRVQIYECGCEFVDMTPALDEHVSRAIMEMQRRRRRPEG
ncbi:MAG: PilZ domain-containing protein [Ruminococcaceae bacterium]|nr:PilZ domain-containing protein [Oscillospiraceae bacterium]